jgi:hypothetical protein
MKPKLLLYLTAEANPAKNAAAATLAWAAEAAGWFFEVYYDAYRLGEHYGGGDPAWLPSGYLTGGTMVGAHHHERLYLLLHRFETVALTDGPVAFGPTLAQLDVPRYAVSGFADLYTRAFETLEQPVPAQAIVIDARPRRDLAGVDAYFYSDIADKHALGLEINALTADDLARLTQVGLQAIQPLVLGDKGQKKLEGLLNEVDANLAISLKMGEAIDTLVPEDDYGAITERVVRRWRKPRSGWVEEPVGGWVLADPTAVAAWIPDAWRSRRLAIYSKPQRLVIERLKDELWEVSGLERTVFGRQYEDSDFFELSSLGLPFQLIDPCRPPFPVLRVTEYHWETQTETQTAHASLADTEPTDEQLRAWAKDGRVLTSLIFWTGMIRELENLPRVLDLVALSKMKGALALTVPAMEYQPEALELLRVPLERGGVFPHLEIMLASCGLGAAIESRLPAGFLADYLQASNAEMERLGIPAAWRPQGWWATMDPEMQPLPRPKLPITPKLQAQRPFLQLRYQSPVSTAVVPPPSLPEEIVEAERPAPAGEDNGATAPAHTPARRPGMKRRLGDWVREHGLRALLAPYRPYEFYAPGPIRKEVIEAARGAGLGYMFSKAGFGAPPTVLYQDADFLAINYTVGHWDGWTPFETINAVDDLRRAEKKLLRAGRPGWLVGQLDTCLWAFTGPIWERASGLRAIADFVARGGDSGRLINVTPRVVARYARLLNESL